MHLNDLFRVKGRFHRSVQIELDSTLDGYIVTESSLRTLWRLSDAMDKRLSTRAWSITGPYGSGKSAFVVFLKSLMGSSSLAGVQKTRELLRSSDKKLYTKLIERNPHFAKGKKGFCPAFVCANREHVEIAVVKALIHGIENFYEGSRSRPRILKELKRCLKKSESGYIPSHDFIIKYCEAAALAIKKSKGAGLLLVIDELGKCLENAALNANGDIFILQKIAELASRSEDTPILFFTVLHQSFERYATRLEQSKRNEWAKIQGRFEDVSFVDSSDQVYKLIASAIEPRTNLVQSKAIAESSEQVFDEFTKLFLRESRKTLPPFIDTLKQCLPLHPLATMALIPLFRSRFAQNERSLFAFLSATEPGSFADFLYRTEVRDLSKDLPLFSLANLYDYFTANVGINLYTAVNGKKWIEIDQGLSRASNETERRIVKSIGILGVLGEALSLSIDERTLCCALAASTKTDKEGVLENIENLKRKSVIVFRRYSSSYALWGGSDIDVEQKIREAKQNKITCAEITQLLNIQFPLRPKVAKRHLYQTGTLRYFRLCYVDVDHLSFELNKDITESDGQVFQVIQTDSGKKYDLKHITEIFQSARPEVRLRTIIGFAENTDRLVNIFSDLLALQWVRKNTPELLGDSIAMREVQARILQLERLIEESTNELFFGNLGSRRMKTVWIDGFQSHSSCNITKKELSNWISSICDKVFCDTPFIKNELINRNKVSSTASAARKLLLHALLDASEKPNLGIEGYPPEMSMYRAILHKSGMHQKDSSENWKFVMDARKLEKSWRPLIKVINKHLEKNENRKVTLTELFDLIKNPPFGIREGVVPIILGALLKAYDSEIALFEQGTFKPVILSTDLDLISKVPQKYSVQLCKIKGVKAEIFDQIIQTISRQAPQASSTRKANLLDIVKMLFGFIRSLPEYVQKTSTLTSRTKKVRDCLLESREPANLLYSDLPKACGLRSALKIRNKDPRFAQEFVSRLRESLIELQRKESELFGKIENILLHTFSMAEEQGNYREIMTERADRIDSITLDPLLKGFLTRVTDHLEQRAWLGSMGTVIIGRPPENWSDNDLLKFEQEMAGMKTRLEKYERLALEKGFRSSKSSDEIMQISVTSSHNPERYRIVHISPTQKEKIFESEKALDEYLSGLSAELDPDLLIGLLGKCAVKLIDTQKIETETRLSH